MRASLTLVLALAGPVAAQGTADEPASAIPWLSQSLAAPRPVAPDEPAAAPLGGSEIAVMTLGETRRDATGLRPATATGLPRTLYAGSDAARLAELMARVPPEAPPPVQALVQALLTAEFDAPRAVGDPDVLFFARIDALLRLGALDPAQALLEQAGATDPPAFRRWWDASLLTGFDARACGAMAANPGVAPTLTARIFCLSRSGDWAAAALTLDTGRALGVISDQDDALLGRFLDPELYEGLPPPVPPRPMTPLAFRLLDGIGETPDTRTLPLAFAAADLRPVSGWKAQLEAAERLARVGVVAPDRLQALYTERRPSASGGVWERAAAIQALDVAVMSGDGGHIATALPDAVARMEAAGLLHALAELYGPRLARFDLPPPVDAEARRLGLLSRDHAAIAAIAHPAHAFAAAVARGADLPAPRDETERMVAEGLTRVAPARVTRLRASDRLGEALLEAAVLLAGAAERDGDDVAEALAVLRAAGLEGAARRTALHLLLT